MPKLGGFFQIDFLDVSKSCHTFERSIYIWYIFTVNLIFFVRECHPLLTFHTRVGLRVALHSSWAIWTSLALGIDCVKIIDQKKFLNRFLMAGLSSRWKKKIIMNCTLSANRSVILNVTILDVVAGISNSAWIEALLINARKLRRTIIVCRAFNVC